MLLLIMTKCVVGKKKASNFKMGPMRLNGINNPDIKKPEKRNIIIDPRMATCWLPAKTDRKSAMLMVAKRKTRERARNRGKLPASGTSNPKMATAIHSGTLKNPARI